MIRAYKFRFYPNSAQRLQLAQDFGCARWVWNRALEFRSNYYREQKEFLTCMDISKLVTYWKREEETKWLANSSRTVLTEVLRDQDTAFENFFAKRTRYPRFKRRENKQSVRYQLHPQRLSRIFKAGELLVLPKIGPFNVRWSRIPQGIPKMVTVSKDACGRYFVAFSCEEAIAPLPETGIAIGIDLGVKDVLVSSDGWKSGNPRHLAAKLRRLKRYQRVMSRRQKGSNRRKYAVTRVARTYAKISDARRDWIQKRTTDIVRRTDVIAIEDLNVKGMVRNRHLARVISDAGLGEVRRQIEYKAAWYGRRVLIADRFEPTSKTCSECGSIQTEMPLKVRAWTCFDCATMHDRDINAARNVLMFATGGGPGSYAHGG
ncbi:MAG: transposase [Nitrososphaera sp.]|nr:transposase [Nitrososphaera sp.]